MDAISPPRPGLRHSDSASLVPRICTYIWLLLCPIVQLLSISFLLEGHFPLRDPG